MIIWSKGETSSYRDRVTHLRSRVSDVFPRHPANSKIGTLCFAILEMSVHLF